MYPRQTPHKALNSSGNHVQCSRLSSDLFNTYYSAVCNTLVVARVSLNCTVFCLKVISTVIKFWVLMIHSHILNSEFITVRSGRPQREVEERVNQK